MTLKLHTQASFLRGIEKLVREHNLSYLDAVFEYAELHQLEPEVVPKLLSQDIRLKLEQEATDLHLINRGKKKLKTIE